MTSLKQRHFFGNSWNSVEQNAMDIQFILVILDIGPIHH